MLLKSSQSDKRFMDDAQNRGTHQVTETWPVESSQYKASIYYQLGQHRLNYFTLRVCKCLSSWQNVVLVTPFATGSSTEAILSILPVSVCLWSDLHGSFATLQDESGISCGHNNKD